MSISAVGFLFQNKGFTTNNYTCTIHKEASPDIYTRNTINSKLKHKNELCNITKDEAITDFTNSVKSITDRKAKRKFIGATIKNGNKETEVHSIFSNKFFAIRTKDESGINHFQFATKKKTQKVLAQNLSINI